MGEPLAYRHKAATPFAPGKGRTVRSGFYASGTHKIIASKECLVEDGRARAILNDVAYLAGQFNIHAYQEDRGKGALRHGVVRCGYATNDVMLVGVNVELAGKIGYVVEDSATWRFVMPIVRSAPYRRRLRFKKASMRYFEE